MAPGRGDISISNLELSTDNITIEDVCTMTADITGTNIAYIYLFVGYYDEESDSILIADKDYIEADDTREIDGIYYPDWSGEETIELEFDWEPILFSLDDGERDEFCLLEPVDYGFYAEDAKYMVEGTYHSGDGKISRYAQIYFDADGQIIMMYAFTPMLTGGAPYAVRPRAGDRFTVYETWIEYTDAGDEIYVREEGGTLTFGDSPLEWYDFDAYPGFYIIGFIVEDFDGNIVEAYDLLEVE